MGSIFIVRHGQTDWNLQRRLQGQQNPKLNKLGKALAEQMTEYLKAHTKSIDFIYSSILDRAVETAHIIARRLTVPVLLSTSLQEMCFGNLEGKLESKIRDELAKFLAHKSVYKFPGGENYDQVYERIKNIVPRIYQKSRKGNVVVVGHQAVNRAILGALLQLSKDLFVEIDQPHHVIFEVTRSKILISHDVQEKTRRKISFPLHPMR